MCELAPENRTVTEATIQSLRISQNVETRDVETQEPQRDQCQGKILARGWVVAQPRRMTQRSPFCYFKASPADHPSSGNDVHPVPVIAAQRRGSAT